MDLIDDPELDDPHARLSTSKAVHKSYINSRSGSQPFHTELLAP